MELTEYGSFADKCFRDTPPPCAAVCPLAYDVREFIKHMRKGSLRSAYKVIRGSLIFPSVITKICPETCRTACVRGCLASDNAPDSDFSESIDLRSLEQICVDKMAGKDPERYFIPQKDQHIAVIGAGLSGLACAYRLASFGYQVRVYEKSSLIGGTLPQNVDRQWARDEIVREFKSVNCDFETETEISSLMDISGDPAADAVYIATGAGGCSFTSDSDNAFAGLVLRGGALTGADVMESVRMGLSAAETINNRLLTNVTRNREEIEIPVPERQADRRFYNLHYDLNVPEKIPEKGAPEAFRCMSCNCSECYDVCPLMDKNKQYPKKICNEMIVTLKPNKSRRTAVRTIMGCTDCKACREACPENIDMGRCIQEAKCDFYESGAMSPAFHDYWLQDMEFCRSEEAGLLKVADESRPADVMYFPGCQLSASYPEYTIRSFEALAGVCENAALLLGCCGVPAKWAGQAAAYEDVRNEFMISWESIGKPLIVTACPSCLSSLSGLTGDMEVISYYHFARLHAEMIFEDSGNGKAVRVMDPCSSIDEPGMADDVRKLLEIAGYDILNQAAEPGCCGFGGHIYNGAPQMYRIFSKRRIEDLEEGIIAASYCANCRDIFASGTADSRHVLGMILGIDEDHRLPPELGDRRENRRIVKRYFLKEEPAAEAEGMEIRISDELIRKMDSELILREQVETLLREAEESGTKIYDEENNLFIAHKRFGTVTIWTMYGIEGSAANVMNVYLHRMDVMEDR